MSNLATSPVFNSSKAAKIGLLTPTQPTRKSIGKTNQLSAEDEQIVIALHTVKSDLDELHNRYDQTTDPLMLESIIYELKAANLKFMYYLNLCKDRGIVCHAVCQKGG